MRSGNYLEISPFHSAVGGLILGIAVSGKTLLTGRVLGVSGTLKGTAGAVRREGRGGRPSRNRNLVTGAETVT